MKIPNLIICGLPGSGKTTVGKVLAAKLNREHFDTDTLIEKKHQQSCRDIYKKHGEQYFREVETSVLHELQEANNSVISLGGGALIHNEPLIKNMGAIIYLTCSLEAIRRRKQVPPASGSFGQLQKDRIKAYERVQNMTINTATLPVEEVVEHIIQMGKYGNK